MAGIFLLAGMVVAGDAAAQSLPRPLILAPPPLVTGTEVTFPPRPVSASPNKPAIKPNFPAGPASASAKPAAASAHPGPAAVVVPEVRTAVGRPYEGTADFSAPLPDEKVLHLVVGHSIFVDTKHRLSRVYITNPDVLSSYTSNPNQIVVTAKTPGLSTLIVWDEVGDTQVYMVSSETEVAGLTSAIKNAFPMETIDVSSSDGKVTLSGTVGTQATAEAAGKLAALYSKDVSNALFVNSSKRKQVRLHVRFAEVDRARVTQLGFNLFGIVSGTNPTLIQSTTGMYSSSPQTSVSTGSSSTGTTVGGSSVVVSNALNFFVYNFNKNVGATIQDLEDRSLLHILAEPNITTVSGEKANFLAGGEFPFPIIQPGGGSSNSSSVTIQFRPYGVKLEFTPLVNADGTIDLTVAPEVSALDYSNAVTISGYTIPALSTRRAQTQVVLQNGQSFAISGLLDQRTTDAFAKTPGIASIPILGALFHSRNLNHTNSELIVIVTPEIVDPIADFQQQLQTPASPVPLMNQKKFDDALPKSVKKPTAVN